MTRALIVVDVQNDFCKGGSLAVPGGLEIGYRIANTIDYYGPQGKSPRYSYMVATKDWHLPDSDNGGHFYEWPEHCVQGTEGAMFHPGIAEVADSFDAIFYKGEGSPAYSGFEGRTVPPYPEKFGHSLNEWLNFRDVTDVDIVGIATDYCVKETAIDAIRHGIKVRIPRQLTVAVGGSEQADLWIRTVYAAQGSSIKVD